MRPLRLAIVAAIALLALPSVAAAHPNEFELRLRLSMGLAPGPPGPAPPYAAKASSKSVDVVGHADPGGGFNADVVAHRGYAYLGSWGTALDEETYENGTFCPAQGVRVYSLFNLAEPTLMSTFADGASNPALAGSWTEKVQVRHVNTQSFKGDLAAVSFQDCRAGGFVGIGLYDVTDPTQPVELSLLPMGIFGVHELWLQPRGTRAFVYAAAIFDEVVQFFEGIEDGEPELRVVDVSDPSDPEVIGGWSAWKQLGIEPFPAQGSFPFNFVHSVIGNESGSRAYVSYWDAGTVILDMADPAHPAFIGRTEFAEDAEGNAHSAWLGKGEQLLIQTDEDFDPGFFTPPGTEISWGYAHFFDIKDAAHPVELGTFKLPSTTQFPPQVGDYTVHDPKVRGSTAYLSYYAEGVVLVDIAKPSNPSFVAQFVPEPAEDPMGVFFPGEAFPFVWGVFPERSYVLASDINSGLWVFQVR